MDKGPTKEQLGRLRWLSILALVALFVSDYGFNALAKPVPNPVYIGLVAIAVGIDVGQLRKIVLAFLNTLAGQHTKPPKKVFDDDNENT